MPNTVKAEAVKSGTCRLEALSNKLFKIDPAVLAHIFYARYLPGLEVLKFLHKARKA